MNEIFQNVTIQAQEITLPTDTMFRFMVNLVIGKRAFTFEYSKGLGHAKAARSSDEALLQQGIRRSKTVGGLKQWFSVGAIPLPLKKLTVTAEEAISALMSDASVWRDSEDIDDFRAQFCDPSEKISKTQETYAACEKAYKFLVGTPFDINRLEGNVKEWYSNY